jgi:hypothetical protein
VDSLVELLSSTGLDSTEKINRTHVYRRVFMNMVKTYAEIYPPIPEGCLLDQADSPIEFDAYLNQAKAESFGT